MKQAILFICVHNSARSQMAAALMNNQCGEFFAAESAGLEPGRLNPLAVHVLKEIGLDISGNKTRQVFDVWKPGKEFQYVITVCSEAEAEGCPLFPGGATRLHWPFSDPSNLLGQRRRSLRRRDAFWIRFAGGLRVSATNIAPPGRAPGVFRSGTDICS